MAQVTNPELVDPQGRLPPKTDGAADRGSRITNEIVTMLGVGVALAGLLIMLWGNTNTRIYRLEDKIDNRIDRVEDRIDRVESKLDARIDKLDDKIDTLDAKFDALLLALAQNGVISPAEAERAAESR